MNGKRIQKWSLCFLTFFLASVTSSTFAEDINTTKKIEVVRAVFDIGSGTTKLKVALVNQDTQKIVKELMVEEQPVSYKADLLKSKDASFSDEVMRLGFHTLRHFKEKADNDYGPEYYVAVATAAFREANNASGLIKRIEKELNVPVKILTQQDEGVLGFYGAVATTNKDPKNLVVWDIGGGSMQFSYLLPNKNVTVKDGGFASETFKTAVMKEVQQKPEASTPNPLTKENATAALVVASDKARATLSKDLKTLLSKDGVAIVGIGGVHYYSIRNQINNGTNEFNQNEVKETAAKRVGMTDKQIDSKYASTEVTNLLLVQGYMDALHINKVLTAKVNMTDGVLINPAYWSQP